MSLPEKIITELAALPDSRKQEVLDFVLFLRLREESTIEAQMDGIIEENKGAFLELAR